MLKIVSPPKINIGYFYGLSRPTIDFKVALRHEKNLPLQLWDQIQRITQLSIDEKIKSAEKFNLSFCASLICDLAKKNRIPISSDLYIKETAPQLFLVAVPYFYPKKTFTIATAIFKLLDMFSLIEIDVDDSLNHKFEEIAAWYQKYIQDLKKTDDGINIYYILSAADRLGLSSHQLLKNNWLIGNGVNARNFLSTLTDKTPNMAVTLASDKLNTAFTLNNLGFPGAKHVLVKSHADLIGAIEKIGYPVVIKPADTERGVGVSADLRSFDDVLEAFEHAQKYSKKILLEKHQNGYTHRLTVVRGRTIKVVKRIAGGVTGDGINSIEQLIAIEQQLPAYKRRMQRKSKHMLSLDQEAMSLLRQFNLTPKFVPKEGQYIRLRRRDNINAGGNNLVINLESIHGDNLKLAEDIARQFNFDIVGIDLIIEDIEKSWIDVGGTVCEINAIPQLASNDDDRLYENILEGELSNKGCIPISIAIYDDLKVNLEVSDLFSNSIFISSHHGIYKNNKKQTASFPNSFIAARSALNRRDVDNLLCLMSYEDLKNFGLPVASNQIKHIYLLSKSINTNQISNLYGIDSTLIELKA